MKKSMTKRDVAKSHKIVAEYLVGLGTKKIDQSWSAFTYRLETPAGALVLSMHTDDGNSVFGRFEDLDRAVACLGVDYPDFNRYSAKWNLHVFADKVLPDNVLTQLKARIERLMSRSEPSADIVTDVRLERESRYRSRGWAVLP